MLHKNYSTIGQHPSTAFSHYNRQIRSTIDMYQTAKASNSTFDRPNTSFLIVHRLNIASQPKEVQFADQAEIQSAEQDLQATFPQDLNNYLQKKFRNFLIRKHEINPVKPTFVSIQNPQLLNTFCSKMEISCMFDKERELSQKKTATPQNHISSIPYQRKRKDKTTGIIEKVEISQLQSIETDYKGKMQKKRKGVRSYRPPYAQHRKRQTIKLKDQDLVSTSDLAIQGENFKQVKNKKHEKE